MTPSRQRALEQGLNGYARKVLDAVPISEPWSLTQIINEMKRVSGTVDYRVIAGCLGNLVEMGLVKEPLKGSFIRVAARHVLVHEHPALEPPMPNEPAPAPAPITDPLKRLEDVSKRIKALGDEVEEIALGIIAMEQQNATKNEKMLQLQKLLKEIGS